MAGTETPYPQARIAALTAEVKRLGELADGYGKLDLEYALLTEKVLESEKLRGQRDAAMAKVEQLTRERDEYAEFERQHDYCCCGIRMEDHDIGSGHSPVSMYDYQHDCAVTRAETAEARVAQLEEALEKLRSYNVDIEAGRINYRPNDHVAVIDSALHPEKEGE